MIQQSQGLYIKCESRWFSVNNVNDGEAIERGFKQHLEVVCVEFIA